MSTIDETTMPRTAGRSTQDAWAQSHGHASATSVVLQSVRVLALALALAGLVFAGFTAAQHLPTGVGIVLGWLLVSFVAAPLVGFVLKAATTDNAPLAPHAQRGQAPSESTRG
ncbi:MAG: hypothetical protein WAK18_05755 [Nocardioidaceae bacterium]